MIILSSQYLKDRKICGNYELIKGIIKCLEHEKKKFIILDAAKSIYSQIPLFDSFTYYLYIILNKFFNIKSTKSKKTILKLLSLKYNSKSDFLILDGYKDMFLALFWSKNFAILISSDLYSKAALSGIKNCVNLKLFTYSILIYIRNLILENTFYRILFKKVLFVSPLDKKLYNNRLFLNPNGKHLIFPVEITCYDNKKLTHFNLNNTNELKNILIIANLDQQSHQRDILKFIHIFNNYCKKNNSIKFHFHGKTEFFKKNIVINDFKNQLIFHSWVDNLVDFYKTFDLVVSPIQNSTGLQTKYLQTFISKTPLALLKNTSYGFSPSILNGYNCIMSNSINGLVDLIHHARDLENISLNAFDYVSENYSIEKISKKVNYQLVD